MTAYDEETISDLASRLARHSKPLPLMYLGLGMSAGLVLGAALAADAGDAQRFVAIGYAGIGAAIGWSLGRSRQASLRLQSLVAVRKTSGIPSP